VSLVIQNITATAQESAAASEELSSQAVLLTHLVNEHNSYRIERAANEREEGGVAVSELIIPKDEGFDKY